MICSACFGHLYTHHQELEPKCVSLPPMVCSAWLLVVGGQVQGSRLWVQEEGFCTTPSAFLDGSGWKSVERISTWHCSALDVPQISVRWKPHFTQESKCKFARISVHFQTNLLSTRCRISTCYALNCKELRENQYSESRTELGDGNEFLPTLSILTALFSWNSVQGIWMNR